MGRDGMKRRKERKKVRKKGCRSRGRGVATVDMHIDMSNIL
jgi:hypothetical protein